MTIDQTEYILKINELYKSGRDLWNKWANEILENYIDSDEWRINATVDLRNITFEGETINFNGYIFPYDLICEDMQFSKKTIFSNAIFYGKAFFSGSEFLEKVYFNDCIFIGTACFSQIKIKKDEHDDNFYTKFRKMAFFNHVTFEDESWFSHVMFDNDVQFLNCTFTEWSRFDDIVCKSSIQLDSSKFLKRKGKSPNGAPGEGGAWFINARFTGQAWFRDVIFLDDVRFQGTIFENDAIFVNTMFYGDAGFRGMQSERMFTLSGSFFENTPDFIQTHFVEAPIFDDVNFKQQFINIDYFYHNYTKFKNLIVNSYTKKFSDGIFGKVFKFFRMFLNKLSTSRSKSKTNIAKYRSLRRLAIQGHDQEKEREFFAGELWESSFFSYKYWLGIIYWLISRHGRSVVRPIVCLIILTIFCFVFYIYNSPQIEKIKFDKSITFKKIYSVVNDAKCYDLNTKYISITYNEVTSIKREAINISLRSSLIDIENVFKSDSMSLNCLYGFKEMKISNNKTELVPLTPRNVSLVMVVQKILAGLFIFLFGFAIRNMLRVK